MDLYLKQTLKSIVFKGVLLCMLCMLLYSVEFYFMGSAVAMQQTPSIAVLATLFFALSLFSSTIYLQVMRRGGKMVFGYYILITIIRLLFAATIIAVYVVVFKENLLAFVINILAFYLVEMITSVIHYTKMERCVQHKK